MFINEEVEMLRNNPYTYAVTPHIRSFTKEFKELFWKGYQEGEIPLQILEKHGYLLQREFESYGPRMGLLTDITYLPYNGTFAYLSSILDAFTKQILAYVVSGSLEVDFVLETVNILFRDHGVSLNQETILHSDQGCHYTSYRFIEILHNKNLCQSMSRKDNCWDNALQESFFDHMKDHVRDRLRNAAGFSHVKAIVDDYIDHYNNDRY